MLNPLNISLVRLKLACMFFGTEDMNLNTLSAFGITVKTHIEPNIPAVDAYYKDHPEITCERDYSL